MSETGIFAKFGKLFAEDYRFVPAIGYLLLSLLVLLFVDKLPNPMQSWLLPSLIFGTICAVFIGWMHAMFFIRNGNETITQRQFNWIAVSHAALIILVVIYWFWRGVA
jgi:ABC-type nickel/cobalt efflux system permease component RcnA